MARTARWLRIAVAAATVLLLALTAWQCVDIYIAGNSPANLDANGVHIDPVFSRDIVAERLGMLALPWAAYVVLVAITALCGKPVDRILPMTPENRLRLAKARLSELPAGAVREEKTRRNIWLAAALSVASCISFSLIFLLDGNNFVSWNLETVMGRLLAHVGTATAVGIIIICAASYISAASIKRELEILKSVTPGEKSQKIPHKLPVNAIRIVLLAASIVLIAAGIMNGGMRDVLIKAINICTECIGLG